MMYYYLLQANGVVCIEIKICVPIWIDVGQNLFYYLLLYLSRYFLSLCSFLSMIVWVREAFSGKLHFSFSHV